MTQIRYPQAVRPCFGASILVPYYSQALYMTVDVSEAPVSDFLLAIGISCLKAG